MAQRLTLIVETQGNQKTIRDIRKIRNEINGIDEPIDDAVDGTDRIFE